MPRPRGSRICPRWASCVWCTSRNLSPSLCWGSVILSSCRHFHRWVRRDPSSGTPLGPRRSRWLCWYRRLCRPPCGSILSGTSTGPPGRNMHVPWRRDLVFARRRGLSHLHLCGYPSQLLIPFIGLCQQLFQLPVFQFYNRNVTLRIVIHILISRWRRWSPRISGLTPLFNIRVLHWLLSRTSWVIFSRRVLIVCGHESLRDECLRLSMKAPNY